MDLAQRLRTYAALGPMNIARVLAYRLGLKFNLHPVQRLKPITPSAPFFGAPDTPVKASQTNIHGEDSLCRFGWHDSPLSESPPDWFANPFSEVAQPDGTLEWWKIADFGTGDIKGLWEISRFDWLVEWAARAAAHGEGAPLERMNLWLSDWIDNNPSYKGPNWKCGQEASIRTLHLVTAAWILGQDDSPEKGLLDLLRLHLQRIEATMSYAIAQDNNHGTSEAAALFIGGSFLASYDARAKRWERKGRQWLENRAAKLIAPDGSFSQYSVNYHRMMLDTFSLSEAWRRRRNLTEFSLRLQGRVAAATNWLLKMTDKVTGDAPNIGANDGAHLLKLTGLGFRDFRPSVQLAAALFCDTDAFGSGAWDLPLRLLGIKSGTQRARLKSQSFNDGGCHVLRDDLTIAVLRYPMFSFRPSQADALHLDFWYNGINILRDAGTFSYNSQETEWFASAAAHNTVEFDGKDQMPHLSRFLFYKWLRADAVEPVREYRGSKYAGAAYTDGDGFRHHRVMRLSKGLLVCEDIISGNFDEACLRWRLAPSEWRIQGGQVLSDICTISIEIDGAPATVELGETYESRYYQLKEKIPQVLVKAKKPTTIVTKVSF